MHYVKRELRYVHIKNAHNGLCAHNALSGYYVAIMWYIIEHIMDYVHIMGCYSAVISMLPYYVGIMCTY